MSAKTAWAVLSTTVVAVLVGVAYTAQLSTKVDLAEHNVAVASHQITVDHDGDGSLDDERSQPIAYHVRDNHKHIVELQGITVKVAKNTKTIEAVQTAQFEQRAEDLAYRAVDRMPKTANRKRVQQKFNDVKARASANLRSKRDIRDGISLTDF